MGVQDHFCIKTTGYAGMSFSDFALRLNANGVRCVVDVRSKPVEPSDDSYTREKLQSLLEIEGIDYVYMGDTLGGIPDDPTVYRNGKIDYGLLRETAYFRRGMQQLVQMIGQDQGMALLCYEAEPENCHRAKLVGAELVQLGLQPLHIDENGELLTQQQVLARIQTSGTVP